MLKVFKPTPEQAKAVDPTKSIWVSANAGSGKTHVLVDRVIRLWLDGADPATILCITYTKAAAAEMSARLFETLGAWTGLTDERLTEVLAIMGLNIAQKDLLPRARRLFTQSLETPGGLKIQTIHAFCERLLHLFPVEAGLAPGFKVMDQRRSDELQELSFARVLRSAERGQDPARAAALERVSENTNKEQFDYVIASFVKALRESKQEPLRATPADYEVMLRHHLGLGQDTQLQSILDALQDIDRTTYAKAAQDLRHYKTANAFAALQEIIKAERPTEALIKFYFTKELTPRKTLISKDARTDYPQHDAFFVSEQARIESLLSQKHTLEIIAASADMFLLAKAIFLYIENEKRTSGEYDFHDLIARAAHLLSTRRSAQWVLYKLDSGLKHILLDEAQDTGPDQWQMIMALAAEFFAGNGKDQNKPRTLFVVGDQKQSIYSFQGADAGAYSAMRQDLVHEQGVLETAELALSYRSSAPILNAVDSVFTAGQLARAGIDARFERPHTSFRNTESGIVEFWPLIEADEKDEEQPWQAPVDRPAASSPKRKLARFIAGKIKSWLNKAAPRLLAGENRIVTPDDILILFRSRGGLFNNVLSELRQAGIAVAGTDRLTLRQSIIVQDLLQLSAWLLLPEDDHALAIILKSPLVPMPLSEEDLFHLAYDRGEQSLASRLSGENAEWLRGLQNLAENANPSTLFAHVLTQCRKAILARLGNEGLEASDAFLDMALDFERENASSLFAFVQWFTAAETTLKREMDKASGAVRLMTVHGAKGLEAPIVILADAAAKKAGPPNMPKIITLPAGLVGAGLPLWHLGGREPCAAQLSQWAQAEKDKVAAETARLLYVAMTRAADELYITGIAPHGKNLPTTSWWEHLRKELVQDRYGADDIYAGPVAPSESSAVVLPQWLGEIPPQETNKDLESVTVLASGGKAYDQASARHGRLVHQLLDELGDCHADLRPALASARARDLGLTQNEGSALVDLFAKPELAPFFGMESRGEVDIAGTLPNGREVSGRLDRLCIDGSGLWLLDYKTDRAPQELSASHPYMRQLALYVALLGEAYPGLPITAALLWTSQSKLEILAPDLLAAAMLDLHD